MTQKSPVLDHLIQKNSKKPHKSHNTFIMKLQFELHEFSESLSFDQIMDTLFIVGQYLNDPEHSAFNKKDIPTVEKWLETNQIERFFQAKHNALMAQAIEDEKVEAVREIMQTPIGRRESWH